MKILVTGPRGFVGARIMEELENAIPCPSLREVDEDAVRRLVDEVQPDRIIHTAAISDIAACERDPAASYRANVELPLWLVGTGVKTILFSTDQVYGGCRGEGPYTEDEAEPVNLYARHKREMEQRSLSVSPDTVLLRAAWMYDMPMYGVVNRSNFLMRMLREPEVSFSSTQHRAVTYVREVAAWMREAVLLPGGIYNYGSENDRTMLETASWLKERLSLPVSLRDSGFWHHLWMDCSRAKGCGICFCDTVGGLERCIMDYHL